MLSRLFVLNKGQTICFSGKGGGAFSLFQQLKLEHFKESESICTKHFHNLISILQSFNKISELTRESSHVAL